MELGNTILKYRKKCNLSQEDLAKEIGVTRQTISKWELDETSPDLKQAIKLARIFGISIDELANECKIKEKSDQKLSIIFKIIKIISITLGIIIFVISTYIIISTYTKDYFSASVSGQGISTYCDYQGTVTAYEVWRYFDTNQIILNTSNEEIRNKFKTYDYTNEQKMLVEIVKYIEANGGDCEMDLDQNE